MAGLAESRVAAWKQGLASFSNALECVWSSMNSGDARNFYLGAVAQGPGDV